MSVVERAYFVHPVLRHPTVFAIICVAFAIFVYDSRAEAFPSMDYGVVPVELVDAWDAVRGGDMSSWRTLLTTITGLFMHGSPQHVIMNMVFMWMFGCLVSQHLGKAWVLFAFFVCGIGGFVLHVLFNLGSEIPCIGASGAAAGLGGVYLGLMLQWKLPWPDVWPLAHPVPPTNLAIFSGIGIAFDVWGLSQGHGGIAFAAHIGGFMTGLFIGTVITMSCRTRRDWEKSIWYV